jgi:hypothetical protein
MVMKVWPRTDELRKVLRHPSRAGFRTLDGPEDWPEDSFTTRLISDGDLVTEEPKAPKVVKEK